jgi:hypothetical protein
MADDPFVGDFEEDIDPPKGKGGGGNGQAGPTTQAAGEQEPEAYTGPVTLDDFIAYLPRHSYFFTPTREPWTAGGVNARLDLVPLVDENGKPLLDGDGKPVKVKPSTWLDQYRAVEQMTWLPGEPMLIKDRLITLDGPIERAGVTTFNLYDRRCSSTAGAILPHGAITSTASILTKPTIWRSGSHSACSGRSKK